VLVADVPLADPFVGALCVMLRAAGHETLAQRLRDSMRNGEPAFDLSRDEREAVLDALSPYTPDDLRGLRDALEESPTTTDPEQ
jgi:hypothetical protein